MQMETLPSGTILHGRYRTERALGSGGFGHVYLSIDLKTNEQCAIKEYLVSGPNGKAQLEHEAQVLSQLHHPNLPAFQTAFDESGHYYVVLGYIEGNDLTDYIRVVRQKNEVIPIRRLMGWLLSICDAVTFLHSQHPPVIHRDIKPDNIRITPDGMAILVDLGNAKTALDGARTLFFIRHQGTPGYAPLEQYPGGSGTDERSDIYALGGTLYFALTAHEPPSVSTRNQALQQKQPEFPSLLNLLAQNPPDSPQEARQFRLGVSKPAKPVPRHSRHLAQLGAIPPDVLRRLDIIIQRAMAMKPQDRYQSVAAFGNDLKAVLQSLPSSNTPPPAGTGRPVDPHSTQPDLPMLYEAMQNAQTQATQSPQSQSSQAVPTNPTQVSGPRCPNCGTSLTRQAPYCPTCGHPLNPPPANPPKNSAGPNAQSSGQNFPPASRRQDISGEETMVMPHHPSDPQDQNDHPRPVSQAQPRPRLSPHSAPTAAIISPQQMFSTTSSHAIPSTQPQITPDKIPASPPISGVQHSVKPFITNAASAHNQTSTPPKAAKGDPDASKKILISLAIFIVSLIIIMLLLIAFIHTQQHHLT